MMPIACTVSERDWKRELSVDVLELLLVVFSQRRIAKRHELTVVERMSEIEDVRLNVSDEPVI